jgi:hypothetical protein
MSTPSAARNKTDMSEHTYMHKCVYNRSDQIRSEKPSCTKIQPAPFHLHHVIYKKIRNHPINMNINLISSTPLRLRLALSTTLPTPIPTSRPSSRLPSPSATSSRTLTSRLPSRALLSTTLRSIPLSSSTLFILILIPLHPPTLLLPPLRELLLSLDFTQVALRNSFFEEFFLQTLLLDDVGDAELETGFDGGGGVADALGYGGEIEVLLLGSRAWDCFVVGGNAVAGWLLMLGAGAGDGF